MACFSCGETFQESEKEKLQRYKNHYDKTGEVSYYYRLSSDGPIFICWANSFSVILENEIKPNFKNGAEYSHICDFNPKEKL